MSALTRSREIGLLFFVNHAYNYEFSQKMNKILPCGAVFYQRRIQIKNEGNEGGSKEIPLMRLVLDADIE
jgi:hypothetical protein